MQRGDWLICLAIPAQLRIALWITVNTLPFSNAGLAIELFKESPFSFTIGSLTVNVRLRSSIWIYIKVGNIQFQWIWISFQLDIFKIIKKKKKAFFMVQISAMARRGTHCLRFGNAFLLLHYYSWQPPSLPRPCSLSEPWQIFQDECLMLKKWKGDAY